MSTKDQLLSVALHGTAMRDAAERRDLAESVAELREMAGGRDDLLAEAAGIEAGSWFAWPSHHVGHELVAAGMLIMAAGHDGKPSTSVSWSGGREWDSSGACGHARVSAEQRCMACVLVIAQRASNAHAAAITPPSTATTNIAPTIFPSR
jgi:hypothetical protein